MSDVTYRVVLTGQYEGELSHVVKSMAALFKKDEAKMQALLKSAPVDVKKSLSEAEAKKYQQALARCGLEVKLEPEQKNSAFELSLEPLKDEVPITGKAVYVAKDVKHEGTEDA